MCLLWAGRGSGGGEVERRSEEASVRLSLALSEQEEKQPVLSVNVFHCSTP